MIDLLQKYAKKHHLLKDSAEETINAILEHLSKDPYNNIHMAYEDELISSSSVVLNGLSRIKDPVKLFRNLGNAFERRGYCIFRNTVKNAFNRLYLNAVKKGKEKEVLNVWQGFINMHTKAAASRYIPLNKLYSLLGNSDENVIKYAVDSLVLRKDVPIANLKTLLEETPYDDVKQKLARTLASKKEIPLKYVYKLLHSPDISVQTGTINALHLRNDLPIDYLKELLVNSSNVLKRLIARSLLLRKDLPKKDIKDLLNNPNRYIKEGARDALVHRLDIPLKDITNLPKHFYGNLPTKLVRYLAMKLPPAKLTELLNNSNVAIVTIATYMIAGRTDLPLDFMLNLTKSDNYNIKENAYTSLFYRPDIPREKVLEMLNSESNNYIKYFRLKSLKRTMLKHISGSRGSRRRRMNIRVEPLTNSYKPRRNKTRIQHNSTHLK